MKKKILKFLVLFISILVVGCSGAKEQEKIEETPKESYEWQDIKDNENYDWTDSSSSKVTDIFLSAARYVSRNVFEETDDTSEVWWGSKVSSIYNEMKKIENDNQFAKQVLNKIDDLKIDEMSTLEEDFLDSYIKLIFFNINYEYENELTFDKNAFISIKDIGKASEVYIENYDDDYNVLNEKHYRQLMIYYPKLDMWVYSMSSNIADDKYSVYIEKKENLGVSECTTCKKISPDIINDMTQKKLKFFNFLIAYRDGVYYKALQKYIEEAKKYEASHNPPMIGMTKEQVLRSSWGSPNHINKDTYSWGTREQWVYNKKGYVYFENGIVTSISER